MNEIICNKCNATFTPDMIEIQKKVITQDEHGDDVIEQYYECPICGAHYIRLMTNQHYQCPYYRNGDDYLVVRKQL